MRKIDTKELFQRLCGFEYEMLKYVYRTQGQASAPINYYEAAESLSVDRNTVRRAIKRLFEADVLTSDGENFKINSQILKD